MAWTRRLFRTTRVSSLSKVPPAPRRSSQTAAVWIPVREEQKELGEKRIFGIEFPKS